MTWYSVKIEEATAKPRRGGAYVEAESENEAEQRGKDILPSLLGLQGVRSITVTEANADDEADIKYSVYMASGYNDAIRKDGSRINRSTLDDEGYSPDN